MPETKSIKKLRVVTIILLFLVGLNALAAGYSFMAEPSGKDIGISTDYLKDSPFENYFVPGLVLFCFNGVLSMLTAILAIKQWRYYPQLIVVQGCILLGWIMIQVAMVKDFNLLHFVCAAIGIVLLMSGRILTKDNKIKIA